MDRESKTSLYDDLGATKIREVVSIFYERAFVDPIIGHFFHGKQHSELVDKQVGFAIAMLGGPRGTYVGRPLASVHHVLPIRGAHFARRQVLMREVLTELGVEPSVAERWLALEEQLRPLITKA